MTLPHIIVCNIFFAPNTYGGATIVSEEVSRELAHFHGWQVSAISAWSRDDIPAYEITRSHSDGLDSYLINLPKHRSKVETYHNPQVDALIGRLIDRLQPDLFHAHCLQDLGAGILATTKSRSIPTILSIHDYWWICPRQFMIQPNGSYCDQYPVRPEACLNCGWRQSALTSRRHTLFAQAESADLITYPSQHALSICEASGLAPGRGIVWRNGVHQPKHDFFDKQFQRRQRDKRITFGYLGGPSQIKGWPDIYDAFSALEDHNFRVLLVDGKPNNLWWNNLNFGELPGDWQVVPRFSQAEIDDFYTEVDVLLFPSQWKETFGLAVREALVRGIDVIQTNSGGTTEHAAAKTNRLIPIDAGPDALRQEIVQRLKQGQIKRPTIPVSSFADQANEFAEFANALINRQIAPAPPNGAIRPNLPDNRDRAALYPARF